MTIRPEEHSHLTINGYTVNPIKNIDHAKLLLTGLGTTYQKEHPCDRDDKLIHKYYFDKLIPYSVNAIYVEEEGSRGLFAVAALTNGYYILRIWDEPEPAHVQFDIYVRGDLDPDICLDHLKAPFAKNKNEVDGLGLFDFTYSLIKNPISFNRISKNNKEIAPYNINNKYNHLDKITCYFCPQLAQFWGILPAEPATVDREKPENEELRIRYDSGYYKNSFMSVPICENHKINTLGEQE